MSQDIKYIKIADLVLWTENPRDPIDKNASDQDIVDKALSDDGGAWNLNKLAKSMGDYYDFSELPIVVYEEDKPIVYDGNRRVILGKIYHRLVNINMIIQDMPNIPEEIPCNVCSLDVALKSVLRKHGESGSWKPLERDKFVFQYHLGEKTPFLILEEKLGIVTNNPELNQGFVRKEIFNSINLEKMGFSIQNNEIQSRHSKEIAEAILNDVINKIRDKKVTTRTSRGQIYDVLENETKEWIENNKEKEYRVIKFQIKSKKELPQKDRSLEGNSMPSSELRKTKRIKEPEVVIFGEDLYLKKGSVNNLYRDICELHGFYKKEKKLSKSFAAIIRMSLRLLCETAAKNIGKPSDKYIASYFEEGKKTLSQDYKTLLSVHNISQGSLAQLLHIGAHNYTASQNYDQTIAISVILGAMLNLSHRRRTQDE